MFLYPLLQEGLLDSLCPSLPSATGSLSSVCSLMVLVPVEEHLEGKDLSRLPLPSPGLASLQTGCPISASE